MSDMALNEDGGGGKATHGELCLDFWCGSQAACDQLENWIADEDGEEFTLRTHHKYDDLLNAYRSESAKQKAPPPKRSYDAKQEESSSEEEEERGKKRRKNVI